MVLGYTTGVFDLFHIGHVRLLKKARGLCDRLVVGVTSDELVAYKNKKAVIPFKERCEVVASCRYVDCVVEQSTMDKLVAWEKIRFDVMFVGDDWFKDEKWEKIDKKFKNLNIKIIYFPYTRETSSTLINQTLNSLRD